MMRDALFEETLGRLAREREAKRRAVIDGFEAGMLEWKTNYGSHAAVTPDPVDGGASWRATYYREDGLHGHSTRTMLIDLLHELADEGYTTPAPGTFDLYVAAAPLPVSRA